MATLRGTRELEGLFPSGMEAMGICRSPCKSARVPCVNRTDVLLLGAGSGNRNDKEEDGKTATPFY